MSKENPLISVVMPAYNSEKYISEAIESILNQSFKDFEFIIIDDGSTDRTWEIIQSFANNDGRIIALRNEENINVARTRNKGILMARGKYIATMDADDISYPYRLLDQYDFITKNEKNIDICIGNIDIIDETGKSKYIREYPITDIDLKSKVYRYNPFPNPTVLCKKIVYDEVGGYDPEYIVNEDFDFWLRAGQYFKFGNCGKTILKYRVSSNSASHSRLRLTEKITFKLRWKALRMGYKYNFIDIIFNLIHLSIYLILPSKIKVKLFNFFRRVKILS